MHEMEDKSALPRRASFAQQRLWLEEQFGAVKPANTRAMAWRVTGEFRADRFERAVRLVAERNPVLLSGFGWDDDGSFLVTERVHRAEDIPFTQVQSDVDTALRDLAEEAGMPFASHGPLMRVVVWRCADEHVVLVVVGRLVFDVGSEPAFFAELEAAYRFSGAQDLPARFDDFVLDQHITAEAATPSVVDRLAVELPAPRPLVFNGARASAAGTAAAVHEVRMDANRLRQLASAHDVPDSLVVLTGFVVVASRWAGQEACSVALPQPNRAPAWGRCVGPCENSLFPTLRVDQRGCFGELLDSVRTTWNQVLTARHVPCELIWTRWVENGMSPGTSLAFTFDENAQPSLALPGCHLVRLTHEQLPVHASEDLRLSGRPGDDGDLRLEFTHRISSLSAADGRAFADAVVKLLDAACAEPDRPLWSVELGGAPSSTPRDVSGAPDVVREIWDGATRWPTAIAVVAPEGDLTYRELVTRADAGARWLLERGLRRGEIVEVHDGGESWGVVAALAVLRAGGVLHFVPPGPSLARVNVTPAVVITHVDWDAEPAHPVGGPDDEHEADEPAGLFVVAGDVVVSTRGQLAVFAAWQRELLGVRPGDRVVWSVDRALDAQIGGLLAALTAGAALVLPEPRDTGAGSMTRWLDRCGATILFATSSLADALVRRDGEPLLRALRAAVFTGEPLHRGISRRWSELAPSVRLISLYGPGEAALATCWQEMGNRDADEPRTIGTPLPGVALQLRTTAGVPCGTGEAGEILEVRPGRSPRRTGDLGRRGADGTIGFLGRVTDLVTAGGVAVHPAQVADVLRTHPGVEHAVVVERSDGHGLAGYVVPRGGTAPSAAALLDHLAGRLAPAAVPSAVMLLDELPASGDPALLPAPPEVFADAGLLEPRDELEAAVVRIFQEVLGIRWVSVHDDFLALGGHPALALRVSAMVALCQEVCVPAAVVLDHSTPASLAAWITNEDLPACDRVDEFQRW